MKFDKQKSDYEKTAICYFFHILANFFLTLDPCKFVSFNQILMEFDMLNGEKMLYFAQNRVLF